MKRILTYSAIILTGLFLSTSCLNEKPQYSQNSQIIFSSESNAQLALLGCYGYMTENTAYGQMWQEVPLVGSGLVWAQRNGADEDRLSSLAATPDNALISSAWRGMYKAICECNAFIEGMKSSGLPDDVKTQMLGEAYFLRALGYYNLVSLFSDVPLKLVASSSDGIAMPRTPKEEVFAAIVKDLQEAAKIKPTSEPGRANAWAAKALLGKVYYKMAMLGIDRETNLRNAKTNFDDVYDAHVYDLEHNYAGLFAPYNTPEYVAKSKEVIFQLNFNSSSTVCYNRGSNRFAPQASTSGINWGTYRVAKYAYDLHNGTYPGDPRVEVNFLTQWRSRTGNNQPNPKAPVGDKLCAADSTYAYPKRSYRADGQPATSTIEIHLPYEIFSNPCNPTKAELDTYSGPYPAPVKNLWNSFLAVGNGEKYPYLAKLYDQGQVAQRSNKHLIVFRYAEMLLEMADVYNELNDTKRAVELANEVLKRARLCSGTAAAQPADWSTSLSKDEVTEKLYFERIFELMGEPCLYDMVRIRGEKYLEKLLLKANNHDLTVGGNKSYDETSDRFCDRVYDAGQKDALGADFLKKNLLLPIPSSEIDANSALTPADNNFGYNS